MSRDAFDPAKLRQAFGTFATGVTVIGSTAPDGRPVGATANSFTSLSLNPPLLLVCLDLRSKTLEAIHRTGSFSVNVLSEGQREISNAFASKRDDKFDTLDWRPGGTGAPLIGDSIGWFDCRLHAAHPGGDHEILVGLIEDFGETALGPLGYFKGGYFLPSLEQESARRGRAVFAAILEWNGAVLLQRTADGRWGLPEAISGTGSSRLGGLLDRLAAAGAHAALDFLFSVAEAPEGGHALIVYRGTLRQTPEMVAPEEWRLIREEDCSKVDFASYEARMTVARYFRERRSAAHFGLFADTGAVGLLAGIASDPNVYGPDEAERNQP